MTVAATDETRTRCIPVESPPCEAPAEPTAPPAFEVTPDGVLKRPSPAPIKGKAASCMFVANAGIGDPRVTHEAEVLAEAGHEVTVVCVRKGDDPSPRRVVRGGIAFVRARPRASWTAGILRRLLVRYEKAALQEIAEEAGLEAGEAIGKEPSFLWILFIHLLSWRSWLLMTLQFIRLGLSARADLYHAHDLNALPAAWICARLRRRPLVYDSHELFLDLRTQRGEATWSVALWGLLEKWLIRQAGLCLTVSDGIADLLKERYPVRKLAVVRNCPRRPLAAQIATQGQARQLCGIPEETKIVIYQGGICPGRGLTTLIGAASLLPDIQFLIVGPEKRYTRLLRGLAQKIGARNVAFTGHKSEEERDLLMRISDLGVSLNQDRSLSYRFSLPNKIFEYFMNGVPALVARLPMSQQVAEKTKACLVADPDNHLEVAMTIRAFFTLPTAARRDMGRVGRRAVMTEYNMDHQMRPVVEFYAKCRRPTMP